jgi:hypothetical protein
MSFAHQIPLGELVAETVIINPAHLTHRRQASERLCERAGLHRMRVSEGTSGLPHQMACTLAHRRAMQSVTDLPCLILEDDLQLTAESATVPPLPADADLVYLSVTPFGCLPWTHDNLALARHRALQGLTLASVHDADWLRLSSMSGGQAILYVTERGRDTWIEATARAERFGGPFDVFTAYAMRQINVYAPQRPVFCEDPAQQARHLRDRAAHLKRRLAFTRTPLRTYAAGDRTTVTFKGQRITVEAVGTASNVLEWQVVAVDRSNRADAKTSG